MKKILKNSRGITLIALIVTIIVLLILAGVTIGSITGQKGTIKQANDAKEQTEIAQEKEILNNAVVYAMGKDTSGNVTKKYLDPELDKSIGAGKYTSDDQTTSLGIIVTYQDSGRSYFVDTNGNVTDFDGTLPVPDITLEVGDYVEYDITYKDIETDYSFTSQDGWRVLDPGTKNADGTFSNVKLISTGVPVNLNYYSSTVEDFVTDLKTLGKWAGNDTQRENYKNDFYVSSGNNIDNQNMYAAAGLYYNFGLVKFTSGTTPNKNVGGYLNVNGKTSGDISGKEFIKTGMAKEAHVLTLAELNKARGKGDTPEDSGNVTSDTTGLFYLKGLNKYDHGTLSYAIYYIVSPDKSSAYNVRIVDYPGGIYSANSGTYGLRVVVLLEDKISLTKIENN